MIIIVRLALNLGSGCNFQVSIGFMDNIIEEVTGSEYKYGFVTNVETDTIGKGLNEEVIRIISAKKEEPDWMLEFRLKAYRHWLTMKMPRWAQLDIPEINYQDIVYYAAPKQKETKSWEEVDPELKATFDKLGIPLSEQMALSGVAVDAVMDSVSVKTTFKDTLAERGVIFCSFSEAVKNHPDLVRKYLGTVAEDEAYVSYLEGCTAPQRDENQLHAAIVEIVVEKNAEVKYSTVQNWYPGDKDGKGGIYNFVTKRGICRGENARLIWAQVETGSAITWKYPSTILKGDGSVSEFYSVAVTNNYQQADTGTKMIHIGNNTRSRIVSKGISAGFSSNSYRGKVKVVKSCQNARNYSQCDSLLLGDKCGAHTFPYLEIENSTAQVEHEATTSKIGEDQIFYCNQRGISTEDAVGLIIKGYAGDVLNKMPMEFAVEAQKLLQISLEGSVG